MCEAGSDIVVNECVDIRKLALSVSFVSNFTDQTD